MSFSRSFGVVISLACLLSVAVGASKAASQSQARSAAEHTASLLPQQFGGWQMQGSPQTSTDPAVADPTNAAVLKEYRFSDVASSTYTRDDGRTLKIRAARFADASGAFGAYTFYLQPEMAKEQIDDQGASAGERVLFYRGNVLVDALFSKQSAMSVAQLRELGRSIASPQRQHRKLAEFYRVHAAPRIRGKHAEICDGASSVGSAGAPISADLVDFDASSEVSLAATAHQAGKRR